MDTRLDLDRALPVLGIIGAGKLGTAIGQAAVTGGQPVAFYDTDPTLAKLKLAEVLPEANLSSREEFYSRAEVFLFALPLNAVFEADFSRLADKIVIDATNYWAATDDHIAELADWAGSTAEYIAQLHPQLRLVKSLNHYSYHDFFSLPRPEHDPRRLAMALASDDQPALDVVAEIVNRIGFDPVPVSFAKNRLLEPNGPVFGKNLNREQLTEILSV